MDLKKTAGVSLNSLVVGSGFYLTQISSVSPIYPLLLLSILLFIPVYFCSRICTPVSNSMVACIFLIATVHFLGYLVWISPINSAVGFYLNFVFLVLAWHILQFVKFETIERSAVRLIDFTISLGIVESVIRWFYPFQDFKEDFLSFVEESGSYFYLYKFNSIMYQDSNFVAMWLLVILVFSIEFFGFKKALLKNIILGGLVFFTICRAAIFSLVLYVFLKIIMRSKKIRLYVFIVSAFVLLAVFFVFGNDIFDDDSFQTKLLIFNRLISNYVGNISLDQLILGSGLSKSPELLDGIAAHNVFIELLLDVGFLGLSYTLYSLLRLASFARASGYYIIFVFFVSGMSFAPSTVPYLYVVLTLLAFISRTVSYNGKSCVVK